MKLLAIVWMLCSWSFLLFGVLPYAAGPLHRIVRRLLAAAFVLALLGKWTGLLTWTVPMPDRRPAGRAVSTAPAWEGSHPHGVNGRDREW
jgi:hypothetical protein